MPSWIKSGEMQRCPVLCSITSCTAGTVNPVFRAGISTTVRYKRFTLNAVFNYQLGHYKRLNPFITSSTNGMLSIPGADVNASTELLNRWQQPGDETRTRIPALSTRDEDVSRYLPDNSLSLGNYNTVYRYSLYNRVQAGSIRQSLRCNRISLNYQTKIPASLEINRDNGDEPIYYQESPSGRSRSRSEEYECRFVHPDNETTTKLFDQCRIYFFKQ